MGGSLLQKVNRDTMSFATKLCFIKENATKSRDVMKTPMSGKGKTSLPGELIVARQSLGKSIMVFDKNENAAENLVSVMKMVYNNGPIVDAFDDFKKIQNRVHDEWAQTPPNSNPILKSSNASTIGPLL